ncbi:CDP-alcohol phosphatidyltransferase family protein [Dongia sp.]|jgi:phosphatidylglycerophosphate synthase|uniref:CDP-alcohol phosphatidyltransferase family protein n=1 Tax=Dongia sp. TaxID=1977262 RepID=UPI0034A58DD8
MLVWIDAAQCGRIPKIFGLTLVERHLQALKRSLPRPTRIVVDLGTEGQKPSIDSSLNEVFQIEWRQGTGDFSARLNGFAAEAGSQPVLLLDGATLPDARLHASLTGLADSVAVMAPKGEERAAMIRLETGLAGGAVDAGDLYGLAEKLVAAGTVRPYGQDEFNGFIRKLRRTIPYYMFRVETADKAAKVEKFMFWSNYKGSTDFFTRYVYPPLVWISVGPLARARVHPNAVTIFSIILALGAIPIWAIGDPWSFWTGFAMAYGMSVLDSVDGKLARLTFTDSRLGNFLDHGLDMVHPPFWYLSWAYGIGLATLGWGSTLGIATILVMVFYVVDRLILKVYPTYFQRAFHTHSKLDGRMRTFIARRNITLPMFILGYALGLATEAFYLIVAWQILTAAYHGARTFWIIVIDRAHLKDRRPTDVASALKQVD